MLFIYRERVIEKVIMLKPQMILEKTDYLHPFQLGFRHGYVKEIVLVVLFGDLWWEQDGLVSLFYLIPQQLLIP